MVRDGVARLSDALLVVAALAVAALVVWLLLREPPRTGGSAVDPSGVSTPRPSSPVPSVDPAAGQGEVDQVLVLGDDSLVGDRSYWVRRLGEPSNAEVDNRSSAGVGYASNLAIVSCQLPACPTVRRQLDEAVEDGAEPDLVVVGAGLHDSAVEDDALRAAVDGFLAAVRDAFPGAEVVVINPMATAAPAPQDLPGVTDVVRSEAREVDATYVDAGQPYLREPGSAPQAEAEKPGPQLLAAVTAVRAG